MNIRNSHQLMNIKTSTDVAIRYEVAIRYSHSL